MIEISNLVLSIRAIGGSNYGLIICLTSTEVHFNGEFPFDLLNYEAFTEYFLRTAMLIFLN